MSVCILTIETNGRCLLNYTVPTNGVKIVDATSLSAEFNGTAHFTKLMRFLETLTVSGVNGKEVAARTLDKYLQKLKNRKGEDFEIGNNISVSYKKLIVDFSI